MDTESPRLRLSILGIVVFSLFAALFARLYYLQIMATDEGEVEAANNRVRTIQEEAPRGRILDAKGRVLVDNRTSLVVTVDPFRLKDLKLAERDDLLLRLSQQLTASGIPTKVATIERRLNDPQYSPLQPVPVAIDVPEDLMVFLAERADDFPSVQVRRESVRSYPEKSLAAHVVGYVGRISSDELKARMGSPEDPKVAPKPYEPDSSIGKTGVEKTFEDDLRGTPGIKKVEVDRNGKVVRELTAEHKAPVPGSDVQLTIDMDVQRTAEQKLAEQLEGLRGRYTRDGSVAQGKVGSSVVLDPSNGHVIAMASYPTYDPTEFVNGINSDRYRQWTDGEPADNPTINRAIAGLYAPGSTFKLVTAHAALTKGVISPNTYYNDTGVYTVGNREFRNAQNAVNGPVQMSRAITISSDTYFYSLGDQFWRGRDKYGDGIQESAREFGYGAPTGVQLPGELGGVVPDPAWKKQFWESLPADQRSKDGDKWYAGDNVNLAIGQGDVLATPLQVADSYATFATKGVRHQVTIVSRVLKPGANPTDPALDTCDPSDGRCGVARRIDDAVIARFDIPDDVYKPLSEGFDGVTSARGGTATELFTGFDQKNWPVFGKTGTAQVTGKADTSLFVAGGPATDPRFVAVAVLEQAGFGADAAGPVVRSIFDLVSGQVKDPACPDPTGASTTTSTSTTTTPGQAPPKCPEANGTTTTVPAAGTGTTTNSSPTPTTPYTTQYQTPTTAYTTPTYTTPTTAYTTPTYTTPTTRYTTPTTAYTTPTTAYRTPTTSSAPRSTTASPGAGLVATEPPKSPTTREAP
jgi:penicillin-binding protein 2